MYLALKSGDGEWPPSMAARADDELPVNLFTVLLVLLWVLLTADSNGVVAALCWLCNGAAPGQPMGNKNKKIKNKKKKKINKGDDDMAHEMNEPRELSKR